MSSPVQFGPSAQPLLGQWHEASGQVRPVSILICPGWGMEYLRMYRGLRVLAQRLSEAGFPVLRFDYSCTGDSAGDSDAARMEDWIGDIATAAKELQDMAGSERVCIFGARLGGLLAQQTLERGLLRAEALVALDPPRTGADFVTASRRLQEQLDGKKNRPRARRAQMPPVGNNELLGHAWPPALAESVGRLAGFAPNVARRSLLVTTSDHRTSIEGIETLEISDAGYWNDFIRLYNAWAPAGSLRLIAGHLGTWLK